MIHNTHTWMPHHSSGPQPINFPALPLSTLTNDMVSGCFFWLGQYYEEIHVIGIFPFQEGEVQEWVEEVRQTEIVERRWLLWTTRFLSELGVVVLEGRAKNF